MCIRGNFQPMQTCKESLCYKESLCFQENSEVEDEFFAQEKIKETTTASKEKFKLKRTEAAKNQVCTICVLVCLCFLAVARHNSTRTQSFFKNSSGRIFNIYICVFHSVIYGRNILTDEFINRRKHLTDEIFTNFLIFCVYL